MGFIAIKNYTPIESNCVNRGSITVFTIDFVLLTGGESFNSKDKKNLYLQISLSYSSERVRCGRRQQQTIFMLTDTYSKLISN